MSTHRASLESRSFGSLLLPLVLASCANGPAEEGDADGIEDVAQDGGPQFNTTWAIGVFSTEWSSTPDPVARGVFTLELLEDGSTIQNSTQCFHEWRHEGQWEAVSDGVIRLVPDDQGEVTWQERTRPVVEIRLGDVVSLDNDAQCPTVEVFSGQAEQLLGPDRLTAGALCLDKELEADCSDPAAVAWCDGAVPTACQ
ncbi:MAG: hypothetical protein AAF799_35185 [Myxococcota bacterium]